MKSTFRGYVPLTPDELAQLWREAIFSFDTNVLLNAYRLNEGAAKRFLQCLTDLKEQLWLPHQVASEFFRHYDGEVQNQFATYGKLRLWIESLSSKFRSECPRHYHIPLDDFEKRISGLATSLTSELQEIEAKHRTATERDPTLALYLNLFEKRIGPNSLLKI